MSSPVIMTAEELRRVNYPDKCTELVRGRLVVKLVWVVDPERRLARIYRADGSQSVIDDAGMLDGEDVVPGFGCRLGTIL